MGNNIRMTYATALVLQALDRGHRYGFDIIDATNLRSGTVYPLLRRLEDSGLIRSKWEHVSIARSSNRPPRKYYELTKAGRGRLGEERQNWGQAVVAITKVLETS